jgi:hypothetical protein
MKLWSANSSPEFSNVTAMLPIREHSTRAPFVEIWNTLCEDRFRGASPEEDDRQFITTVGNLVFLGTCKINLGHQRRAHCSHFCASFVCLHTTCTNSYSHENITGLVPGFGAPQAWLSLSLYSVLSLTSLCLFFAFSFSPFLLTITHVFSLSISVLKMGRYITVPPYRNLIFVPQCNTGTYQYILY